MDTKTIDSISGISISHIYLSIPTFFSTGTKSWQELPGSMLVYVIGVTTIIKIEKNQVSICISRFDDYNTLSNLRFLSNLK